MSAPLDPVSLPESATSRNVHHGLRHRWLLLLAAYVWVPIHADLPQSPESERRAFQLADPTLEIELVCAEPNVVSPVAIAWDSDRHLYVAEMRDYPNAAGGGTIRSLQDLDGDGLYETATLFADQLPFPTSVLPWRDGLIVAAAPDIWYLRDEDHDGRADQRRKLISGFGTGNQQLRLNGLLWGLDNWVYGANGRSDGEIVTPASAQAISIRGRDFRFRPETGEFETLAGRSQFGLARDDWGQRFLSWNTIPIRHEIFPDRFYSVDGNAAVPNVVADILPADDPGEVFPRTPNPRVFNNESSRHFNALAGLTLFRGDALGSNYYGNVFVGESLRNLVHRRILETQGVSWVARRGETNAEFLTSSDSWFHPVNFATGPDGCLYVVDFYREFVEHPDWVAKEMRDKVEWKAGGDHGRLWRIKSKGTKRQESQPPASLVTQLGAGNGWQRDTAQRLIYEKADPTFGPRLKELATNSPRPETRAAALHLLAGLKALDEHTMASGLRDVHPRVREQTLTVFPDYFGASQPTRNPSQGRGPTASSNSSLATIPTSVLSSELRQGLVALAKDPDPRIQVELAMAASCLPLYDRLDLLARLTRNLGTNQWLERTLETAALGHAENLTHLILSYDDSLEPNASSPWLTAPSDQQLWLLENLGMEIARNPSREFIQRLPRYLRLIAWLKQESEIERLPTAHPTPDKVTTAFVTGLSSGHSGTNIFIFELSQQVGAIDPNASRRILNCVSWTTAFAFDPSAGQALQLLGIQLLRNLKSTARLSALLESNPTPAGDRVNPGENRESDRTVQLAATEALLAVTDNTHLDEVFGNWQKLSPSARLALFDGATKKTMTAKILARRICDETIPLSEFPSSLFSALERSLDVADKEKLAKFRQRQGPTGPVKAMEKFAPSLAMKGNPERGGAIVARLCIQCHYFAGYGQRVGPDLSGAGSRPKEALLSDIIDPNRQVAPDYLAYEAVTKEGDVVTGLLVNSNPHLVQLRRPGGSDETILRSKLNSIRQTQNSLMPEGLEAGLEPEGMADLLAFLLKPDPRYIH